MNLRVPSKHVVIKNTRHHYDLRKESYSYLNGCLLPISPYGTFYSVSYSRISLLLSLKSEITRNAFSMLRELSS